ncbi:MAG: GrpB family protein [Gemmataceae bacterium]
MLIIHDYQPIWPAEFEAHRAALQDILGSVALRIDHIGSTSVPGLGAKDIIDIQITVAHLVPEVRDCLKRSGYKHQTHITHDHVPFGEDDNPRLWAKFIFREPQGHRRANVHVRQDGNPNQRYALLFRDYLRAHPNSAKTVESIKRQLVKYHPHDVEAYYKIKDPVYDLIWDAAQGWARATKWQPTETAQSTQTEPQRKPNR